jgi:hypothetical protein
MPPNSKNFIKKKEKKYTRRGGTRPKPSEEKQTKNVEKNYYRLRKYVVKHTNNSILLDEK